MAGYSGTPLIKKLGIKDGYKVFFKNHPENYQKLLVPLPEKITILRRLSDNIDFIHFFAKHRSELEKELRKQIARINQNGMIWVSWPKKSSRIETDITENVIREVALPMGLVDVKVCAVDETWSALKLVIRRENRV